MIAELSMSGPESEGGAIAVAIEMAIALWPTCYSHEQRLASTAVLAALRHGDALQVTAALDDWHEVLGVPDLRFASIPGAGPEALIEIPDCTVVKVTPVILVFVHGRDTYRIWRSEVAAVRPGRPASLIVARIWYLFRASHVVRLIERPQMLRARDG